MPMGLFFEMIKKEEKIVKEDSVKGSEHFIDLYNYFEKR